MGCNVSASMQHMKTIAFLLIMWITFLFSESKLIRLHLTNKRNMKIYKIYTLVRNVDSKNKL